jgi:D-alanyl-D-alanine carboxypeptidase (penicillin-binding protein 5/6)
MKNYFLHTEKNLKGLTGGKTGSWEDDDCSVVASFRRQGLKEVLVLLKATKKGRPKDSESLMEFSHEVTPGFAVPAEGSTVETAWIRHGERTRAALTADKVTYAYPAENEARDITTEIVYDRLEAPLSKGDVVGEFLVYADDKLIGKRKLVMAEDVDTGWLPSYLYISNKATGIILGVLAAFVLLILVLRTINKKKRQARKRLREKYRGRH